MAARARHMCPICGKEALSRPENQAFPFCSPPCKLVDLGAWLDGAYFIPGPEVAHEGLTDADQSLADAEHEPAHPKQEDDS